MDFLQQLIHRLEVGGGLRLFRTGAIALAVVMLLVGYNWRAFRNFSTQEAMDTAQLARNLAQGKGYTTSLIRPLSVHLLSRTHAAKAEREQASATAPQKPSTPDPGRLKGNSHPDLANPPLYPLLLSGLMRIPGLFDYEIPKAAKPWWSRNGQFYRYQPDFLISAFNQALFLGLVVLVFFTARKLFDAPVAWISAGITLGTEVFWRFSISGQSTILLLFLFMGMVLAIVSLEEEFREPRHGVIWPFLIAGAIGLLLGLGVLTRYSYGWLVIPVVAYVVLCAGRQRWGFGMIILGIFALCLAPWIYRNVSLCGAPFGTATYAYLENTGNFGDFHLQRSLNPDLTMPYLMTLWAKLMENVRPIITSDLPRLGGTWLTAFFLVGLLVAFQNPGTRLLRYFIIASLGLLAVVQSLGRTQLSIASPEINSENLLVLLAPLIIIYGVSLFYLFFEQIVLPFRELRYVVIALFVFLACLPLVLTFLPPRIQPVAYPPYYPPALQTVGNWLKEDEMAMSDLPWALAWYGRRQTMWYTLRVRPDLNEPNVKEDFFLINDYQKPVAVLYLSPSFMDLPFGSHWVAPGDNSWGGLVLSSASRKEVPAYFSLRAIQPGWFPSQFVVLDSDLRYKKPVP